MIGTVVGARYRILNQLGQGAMGHVYLAEHVHLDRKEAIKVLRPSVAVDPQFVSRFRREARATNRVQHPNIVSVYDFGRLPDGRLFLAMEFADGEGLDARLAREGALAVHTTLPIVSQLSAAIEHAHSRGVIHRDLKPANVILVEHRGNKEHVKVLDFGMAKIIAPEYSEIAVLTLRGETFGTPAYMAPEQFTAPGEDPRTDIYAVGCIAYELLTGSPPFVGQSVELMHRHQNEDPIPPSARNPEAGIPAEVGSIVLRCLAKSADDRFQTAAELVDALRMLPGAAAKRRARRTRRGFAAPKVLDFDEDTDVSTGSSTYSEHFAEPLSVADSDFLSINELRAGMADSLLELAESLADNGANDQRLSVSLARIHALAYDVARSKDEHAELRKREAKVEQTTRERESSLRFAIGELKFDLEIAGDSLRKDLDLQLKELEERLEALTTRSQAALAEITDQAIEHAATAAALQDDCDVAYRELQSAVEMIIPRFDEDLSIAPLIDRYQSISAALGEFRNS